SRDWSSDVCSSDLYSRKGSIKNIATNARIIVSSREDLRTLAESGKFNKDLYFKINVFEFHLPSLKERPEDVMLYFQKFLKEYSMRNKKSIKDVSPEVKKALV